MPQIVLPHDPTFGIPTTMPDGSPVTFGIELEGKIDHITPEDRRRHQAAMVSLNPTSFHSEKLRES